MRGIGTRLAALERHEGGNPALVAQWEAMLTGLYTGCQDADEPPDFLAALDATRQSAAWFGASGSPATISDFFRLMREMIGDGG